MFRALSANLLLNKAPYERLAVATTTLIVNNTTGSVTMFTLTGTVKVLELWGEVTTVLSAAVTAAYVEMNDSTATLDVTLATGVTLSAAPVGSLIFKEGLTAAALNHKSNAAAFFEETTPAGQPAMNPFIIGKKTAVATTLQLTYSTTDAPSSGAIRWYARYVPLSADGNLA